jgi:hypothetical protein
LSGSAVPRVVELWKPLFAFPTRNFQQRAFNEPAKQAEDNSPGV